MTAARRESNRRPALSSQCRQRRIRHRHDVRCPEGRRALTDCLCRVRQATRAPERGAVIAGAPGARRRLRPRGSERGCLSGSSGRGLGRANFKAYAAFGACAALGACAAFGPRWGDSWEAEVISSQPDGLRAECAEPEVGKESEGRLRPGDASSGGIGLVGLAVSE